MKKSLAISAILLFAALAGIGYALTPPPPPPPPVPQALGLYDTGIDQLVTSVADQSACRACHQTTGTNISGGYNNTLGGVPTRHHNMMPRGVINPLTGIAFNCQDCHPTTPGVGMGILLDRSCTDCHNGTSFWGNSIGGHVGNFSRPHHVNTSYDDANIGNPAAARQCSLCHGSFVANYNDGHYVPSYNTDFMITPFASFKATDFNQPDGLGGNKTWGGCYSCHLANPAATPFAIGSNHDNHHKEITGLGRFGGKTVYQNASTPGETCNWCHVINGTAHSGVFEYSTTNSFTGELLTGVMELRNSTIESFSPVEFTSPNGDITVNGTGCEKCHDVKTLHNIEAPGAGSTQGLGHIANNTDCNGCHNSWLPADSAPMAGAIIPSLDNVDPAVIPAGKVTTLTISGGNFVNDVTNADGTVTHYTSVVTVDGVKYTPSTITDSQIVVNIPALTAGTHQLQLVKGDNTLSKLVVLTAVSNPTITSATFAPGKKGQPGTITISGTGFGAKSATNANLYVSVNHAGNQITSSSITKWTNTQITAKISNIASGDVVTVLTTNAGEAKATIK